MFLRIVLSVLIISFGAAGCVDKSPPPPRVAVPQNAGDGALRRSDPQKPMPYELSRNQLPPPAFDDVAMIDQEMPERQAFLNAYERVGKPVIRIDNARQESDNSENTAVILQFIDWLRCGGKVDVLTPGAKSATADIAVLLSIDVVRDDRNTVQAVRLAAIAKNVGDELLLGQGLVDMPQPIDRQAINRYTRFVARKLMSDMTGTWESAPRAVAPPLEAPAPAAPALPPAAPGSSGSSPDTNPGAI
ncbi:MAG TPA: hypothetical protein PLD59_11435 [Tepidisphaeraceae bacterium]|nr:hypothetical protein [Tepidisphaeraceae bacterium]